ncbi:MAG: hypothetical protein ACTSSE_16080 [Candidatus Thorarchaeota archaeon]
MIVADAHQYLLDHYDDGWDFIWSSPPCPTHSRLVLSNVGKNNYNFKYPDMSLYQEILILRTFSKSKYCIENVITYYDPLIEPRHISNHYFWSNFYISDLDIGNKGHRDGDIKSLQELTGFDLTGYDIPDKRKLLRNCVNPKLGKHVFDCAFKVKQQTLFDG